MAICLFCCCAFLLAENSEARWKLRFVDVLPTSTLRTHHGNLKIVWIEFKKRSESLSLNRQYLN